MSIPILHSRSLAQDFYVHALRSVYQSGYRIMEADYATSKDHDIYEKIRRDPVIAQAIETRLNGVAARTWRTVPGSDEPVDKLVAKMCEEALKQIRRFTEARHELAQGVIRNSSFCYIEGERRLMTLAGTAPREWWVPTRLKDVDRRRFRLVPKWTSRNPADRKLDVNWETFSISRGVWEHLEHPEYFIKVTFNDEEARLGYGRGLLEAMYFYHWIKGEILKEGLHGIKKWARGKTIAKIDGLRAASSGTDDRQNDAVRTSFLEALQRMEEENILVIDKDDEVENIETTGTGHQLVMEAIRYLDGALTSLILGSRLPFGGGEDVGSNARASTELDVHESLIQFDREKIDEDITHDLIGLWVRMNRANFVELGLGAARRPSFETMQEKKEDPEKNARLIQSASTTGIDLRKDEVYKKIGFTPPQEGDDVIKGSKPTVNPFGSPFDDAEFDRSMPDEKSAKLARALMKAGTKPEDAVRCAIEDYRAGQRVAVVPSTPPAPPKGPDVHVHSVAAPNVTVGPPEVHIHPEIKVDVAAPLPAQITVELKPSPKKIEFQKDASGAIVGANITPKGAA